MFNFGEVKLRKAPQQTSINENEKKLEDKLRLQEQMKIEKEAKNLADTINKNVRAADIENWYESLKSVTYATEFEPISLEEGMAMLTCYDCRCEKNSKSLLEEGIIATMTERLQIIMDKFPNGAFVKLSSRSAKDSSASSTRTNNIYKNLIGQINNPTLNDKLIAINRAHILGLQLKEAKEVVDMFLSSERINSDLKLAIEYKESWSQHFIIREFVPIPIEYEFRAFIVDNKFKAMCQYYHYIFFPTLVENKEAINNLVIEKWNEVKDLVPLEPKTYVADFAVDLKNDKVYIIELNPFGDYEGMGTSSSMFKLHSHLMDRQGVDRELFFGDREYEFRIETQLHPDDELDLLTCAAWKKLFKETQLI